MTVSHIKARVPLHDLIGRPYKEGGRGPADYDCWGLCMAVATRAGKSLPEIAIPESLIARDRLARNQLAEHLVRLEPPRPWCLVLFRMLDDKSQVRWHVGIMMPDGRRFMHTTEKLGVHVADRTRQPWKLFLEGFYQYR